MSARADRCGGQSAMVPTATKDGTVQDETPVAVEKVCSWQSRMVVNTSRFRTTFIEHPGASLCIPALGSDDPFHQY